MCIRFNVIFVFYFAAGPVSCYVADALSLWLLQEFSTEGRLFATQIATSGPSAVASDVSHKGSFVAGLDCGEKCCKFPTVGQLRPPPQINAINLSLRFQVLRILFIKLI